MITEATPITVVRNVRIFDGTAVLPASSVLIEQGLIADVRPGLAAPPGAVVVNGRGRTLLPGFFDCHTHVSRYDRDRAGVFGVTTPLDVSTGPHLAALPRGRRLAAREVAAFGPLLPRVQPVPSEPFDDVRLLRAGVGAEGAHGDIVQVVVTTAHGRHRWMIAHIASAHGARQAMAAKVDGLAHLFVDAPADDALVESMVGSGVFVIPTLTALQALCGGPSGAELVADRYLRPYLDDESRVALTQALPILPGRPSRFEFAEDTVARLHAAGVPILVGTDAPSPGTAVGVSVHRELELLVDAGLRPVEALAAATSVPARCFGLADRGRVARGLYADLVLVDGDPTSDIRASRAIVAVWRQGVPVVREERGAAPAAAVTLA